MKFPQDNSSKQNSESKESSVPNASFNWRKDLRRGIVAGLFAAVLFATTVLCVLIVTTLFARGTSASVAPKQTLNNPPTAQTPLVQRVPSSTPPSTSSQAPATSAPTKPVPTTPPQPTALARSYYSFVSKVSNLCIDVKNESRDNGTPIWQFNCNGKDNQLWTMRSQGGSYEIIGKQSGKCLGPARGIPGPGANMVQSDCVGGKDQLWNLVSRGTNLFELHGQSSGLCMEVAMASREVGDYIILYL
ncbi:MAG: RICIN domain-containing protein [Chloroflexi bacterium]|nr:RICIN domain-containing protein [Chloroflexota bacterium]